MIDQLKIERFKSIRTLDLPCRRINLFVGQPNVGKSNILEALGLVSWCASSGKTLHEFVRFHVMQNLFFDNLTDQPIRIEWLRKVSEGKAIERVEVKNKGNDFVFDSLGQLKQYLPVMDYTGNETVQDRLREADPIKFYRFKPMDKFESADPSALIPPDGKNLFSIVYGNKQLREWLRDIYLPYGLACVMKPHEQTFELQKNQEGIVTAFPYTLSSDTLQRMLFYHVAIASNKDAVLVFEEPEAHAFPYYTKQLGESIALGDSNQYFIATHNPYMLRGIVEKAPRNDVAVFATYYADYETKVKLLSDDELSGLMEADPFLGLDLVLDGVQA